MRELGFERVWNRRIDRRIGIRQHFGRLDPDPGHLERGQWQPGIVFVCIGRCQYDRSVLGWS